MRWAMWATVGVLAVAAAGCGPAEQLSETGPPEVGFVRARVVSTFGVDDVGPGINIPEGLQVFVGDGAGQPIIDAVVRVYPDRSDATDMLHQGGGRYELDVLSDRIEPPAREYWFEVRSEFLAPNRIVLRVPHERLEQQPDIGQPADSSEQPAGVPLPMQWLPVEGAQCYDIETRAHELDDWTPVYACIDTTTAAIDGAQMNNVSFIRVRALHWLGDETFATAPYYSRSASYSQVRIFLTEE